MSSEIFTKENLDTYHETGFGIAWFLGSWILGILYDISPMYLVIISVAAQLGVGSREYELVTL